MKLPSSVKLYILATLTVLLSACSHGYDASKCADLTSKMATGQKLSQDDYADMIEQYGIVLDYLVNRTDSVVMLRDSAERHEAGMRLRADSLFRQRTETMLSFSSALFRARASDRLNDFNLNNYLDLAPYSTRFSDNMTRMAP